MAFSCLHKLPFCAVVLVVALYVLCLLFIPSIVVGSIAASGYVTDRNVRDLYTNTNCLLLNYSIAEHQCETCNKYGCWYYTCFDEHFQVSYPIFNDTRITSVFVSFNGKKRHVQTEIGKNYTCFYQLNHITSIIWDLPNLRKNLILLSVSFGLVGLTLILLIIYFLYHKIRN